jgi:hypothetical protein
MSVGKYKNLFNVADDATRLAEASMNRATMNSANTKAEIEETNKVLRESEKPLIKFRQQPLTYAERMGLPKHERNMLTLD